MARRPVIRLACLNRMQVASRAAVPMEAMTDPTPVNEGRPPLDEGPEILRMCVANSMVNPPC